MNITTFAQSGLCDKMMDLLYLSTLSKLINKTFYLRKDMFSYTDPKKFKFCVWRQIDTQYNILNNFINIPNITFVDNYDTKLLNFNNYLGGCSELNNFNKKYCNIDQELFNKTFIEVCNNITFKNININIPEDTIGIHLRRTDKISNNPDEGMIHTNKLNDLDNKTFKLIDRLSFKHQNFFICSDDLEYLEKIKKYIQNKNLKCFHNNSDNYITYKDLYCLSKCSKIVMSCKSSNFSMFASLIGNKNIINIYDTNYLNSYKNIINFTKYTDSCTIIGHQGYADFFSQNGLYNIIIKNYKNIIIFINDLNKYDLLKALFNQDNISVQILNETSKNIHNNYDGKSTCINCHTLGHYNLCPRLLNVKCVYIDYELYKDHDNYKLNAFDDYIKWEKYYKTNFLLSFYTYYNLTFQDCLNNMNIHFIDKKYDNDYDYIIKHSDPNRRLNINLNTNLKIIELNNLSKNMIDTVNLIKKAKEIHVIDSSYSVMIMLLQKKYNLFNNIPIYLYNCKGRDHNIYFNLPDNWNSKFL